MQKIFFYAAVICISLCLTAALAIFHMTPPKPEPVRVTAIADNEYEPSEWGRNFPHEYDSWLKTKEMRPAKSKYKKGYDVDGVIYDKISEFPYMALLFSGWGFGVEYNEPRGHYYMMIDQSEVDHSRVKAGGVCLNCKTPYMNKLVQDTGGKIFSTPYNDAVNMIPEKHRELGVACIDCHDNKTMDLRPGKWTAKKALEVIGQTSLTRQQMRLAVCGQCHVTYVVPKDAEMRSTSVFMPWQGGKWGDIPVETIIKNVRSAPANNEWTQAVTGFKVGFVRHPEFEFFTRNSVHFKAGASCADCHMPYKRVGANKISDHNIMSPLKDDMRACIQCHAESPEWLRERVTTTQDRTLAMMSRSGYAVATVAKLFELAHNEQAKGRTIETALYDQAKDLYLEAFYRVVFLGAENSMGFHNPTEAMRIGGDAAALATKAEALLRQGLTKAGVDVPATINLELSKYINGRGTKKLNFKPEFEFRDPTGIEDMLLPEKSRGL
jgi:nitrite reductase (cytochrome c-552)